MNETYREYEPESIFIWEWDLETKEWKIIG